MLASVSECILGLVSHRKRITYYLDEASLLSNIMAAQRTGRLILTLSPGFDAVRVESVAALQGLLILLGDRLQTDRARRHSLAEANAAVERGDSTS